MMGSALVIMVIVIYTGDSYGYADASTLEPVFVPLAALILLLLLGQQATLRGDFFKGLVSIQAPKDSDGGSNDGDGDDG